METETGWIFNVLTNAVSFGYHIEKYFLFTFYLPSIYLLSTFYLRFLSWQFPVFLPLSPLLKNGYFFENIRHKTNIEQKFRDQNSHLCSTKLCSLFLYPACFKTICASSRFSLYRNA